MVGGTGAGAALLLLLLEAVDEFPGEAEWGGRY